MYVLVATHLPSAALRGSGLVARALLRADLFEKNKKGEDTRRHTDECASRTGTLPHRSTRGTPAHRRLGESWRVLALLLPPRYVQASRESLLRKSLAGPPREEARIYLLGPIPAVPSISLVWFGVLRPPIGDAVRPPLSIPSSAHVAAFVCVSSHADLGDLSANLFITRMASLMSAHLYAACCVLLSVDFRWIPCLVSSPPFLSASSIYAPHTCPHVLSRRLLVGHLQSISSL